MKNDILKMMKNIANEDLNQVDRVGVMVITDTLKGNIEVRKINDIQYRVIEFNTGRVIADEMTRQGMIELLMYNYKIEGEL